MVAPNLVAIKKLPCSLVDTTFFVYQTCQPDTLAISQPITHDTLLVNESCGLDTIDYLGNEYTIPGSYIIDTTMNYFGCDSIYHKIILIDHSETPSNQITDDFLCLGDTLLFNNLIATSPGAYLYDTVSNVYGCDSLFLILNLDGPIIDTVEVTAEIGDMIAGVKILGDTILTDTIWSSINDCESALHTYIVYIVTSSFELLSKNIRTYPNPTNSLLLIDNIPTQIVKINMTNALGNRVYSKNNSKSNVEIDVSIFPNGIYILHLIDNQKRTWHKTFTKIGN